MNTFSERKALYHTNVDVAFDLQSHQILLSAANIKTSTDTSFNFENFEEKQILGVFCVPDREWHIVSYPGKIRNIEELFMGVSNWHTQLIYSQSLSDEDIRKLLDPNNPRLALMAKFLPGHKYTTNHKRRLILFIRDYFNYHGHHAPIIQDATGKATDSILDIGFTQNPIVPTSSDIHSRTQL